MKTGSWNNPWVIFQGSVPLTFPQLDSCVSCRRCQQTSAYMTPCGSGNSPSLYSQDLYSLLCSFTALSKLELPCGSWFCCTAQVAKLINFESSTSGLPSGLGHLNMEHSRAPWGCLVLITISQITSVSFKMENQINILLQKWPGRVVQIHSF